MNRNRQSLAGILLILSAAMLWGTTGTAQTFAPLTLLSYWVGSMRLLVAGVFFLLWMALSSADELRPSQLRRLPWSAIILAAVAMAVYNLAFFAGIRATGVALALAEPITAVVLAILIVGERPAPISFVGLVLMFAGLSVLIRSEVSGSHSTSTGV